TDRASFTEAQIAAFRLHRHHLDVRVPSSHLPNVVRDVCGVQAQVTAMARIALWSRLRDLTVDDVERALEQKRTIVKTWSMRGALHLLASNELLLYLRGLMPTRLLREPPSMPAEDKAEDALVRHHLSAFGPADVADLWAWSGVYVRRLRVILDRLREELVEVDQGDRHAYLLKKDLRDLEKAATDRGAVRLLPSFDPFLQGQRRRDHLVDRSRYKQVYKDQ